MAIVPDAVPEDEIDDEEIFRRGGANHGNENFALCKCPVCNRIFLIEYEVDTLYLDAEHLERRVSIDVVGSPFNCQGCGTEFPRGAWIGPKSPADMQVTWNDLANSPWRWVCVRTRHEK